MKRKNIKLVWNVLNHDFNRNKIYHMNIFRQDIIDDLIKKLVKKKINNYGELKDFLQRNFKYYYMYRAEYEMLIGGLFVRDIGKDLEKIDVWYQIESNLDRICEYVIRELQLNTEVFKNEEKNVFSE